MKLDEFLKSLGDVLSPEKTGARAEVQLCSDRMHAYQVLLDAPAGAYRIAVSLDASKPAGRGMVQGGPAELVTVLVAVLRPMGLTAQSMKGLHSTTGGGLSLLSRADQVRRLLAGARWFLEPGVPHDEIDPEGLRWGGQRILHLDPGESANDFVAVTEQTWEVWIMLDPPAVDDCQEIYFGDPWTLRDQMANKTLKAREWTDRTDRVTFTQTTAGITLTLEAPTDGTRKAMTFHNTGTAAVKVWPAGMTDGVTIGAGVTGLYHWDASTASWQPGL